LFPEGKHNSKFAPHYDRQDDQLRASGIMAYINSNQSPTFLTELVRHFCGNRTNQDIIQVFKMELKRTMPRELKVKLRILQFQLVRQLSFSEVWKEVLENLPEFVLSDIRKENEFLKHDQSQMLKEDGSGLAAVDWLCERAQHFFTAAAPALREE
jgi:hypothetical protein